MNNQLTSLLEGLLDCEDLLRKHMEVCKVKGLGFTSELPEFIGGVKSLQGIGEDDELKNIILIMGRIEHTPSKTPKTPAQSVRRTPLSTHLISSQAFQSACKKLTLSRILFTSCKNTASLFRLKHRGLVDNGLSLNTTNLRQAKVAIFKQCGNFFRQCGILLTV
jgi:hypothetical protein